MKRYVIRRLLEMIPTTFGVLVLTFLLFHVVAGSPAEVVLGKNASAEALADFDARFGYDKPLLVGRWTQIRALPDLPVARLQVDAQSGRAPLPLTYPLPEGTYRVPVGQLQLHFEAIDTPATDDALIDGESSIRFSVRKGWRVTGLDAGKLPEKGMIRLEKQNAAWWDSQFVNYITALLRGDLGVSSEHHLPVARILKEGCGPSLMLTVPILIGGTLVGVMLGLVCAAWRGGKLDRAVLVGSTILMSVNYVVWVLAGQFFLAFKLRLFPIWGFESAFYLLLPVIIGIVSGLGRDVRFYRAAILDEIYKPYVRTAYSKGLSEKRILLAHVLRNSLIPILTYVSLSVPFLFTGSLMLESFFGIPGLGNVSLNAIHSSDMAVVRAVVVLGALLYQVVQLMTDLCYAWLDPRIRLQ
ncbi:MAG: ABC transporter permease [Kiritimatiellae bacterium]|nr:ABC transporter permease [Kiritimatiellia bacterium]